jgi:hypothetical protein
VDIVKAASIVVDGILTRTVADKTQGLTTSNVKQAFFQDRLLCSFINVPPKNQIYLFLKQNSFLNQNVFFQISKFLFQNQLF